MADIDSVIQNASKIVRNLIQHDGRIITDNSTNSSNRHRTNRNSYKNGAIKKKFNNRETFARENVCDRVTVLRKNGKHTEKNDKMKTGLIKFDKYPRYENEKKHGIPFL